MKAISVLHETILVTTVTFLEMCFLLTGTNFGDLLNASAQ